MKDVCVKDIMIYQVFTALASDSVVKVARILQKKKIHAMPVVDAEDKVVGMIAETDFYLKNGLNFHIPTYINLMKQASVDKDDKTLNRPEIRALLDAKVSDIMTQETLVVNQDMNIADLLEIFKKNKLYTLPVVDSENVLVGIVTIADVIKLL